MKVRSPILGCAALVATATLLLSACSTIKTRIADNPPAFYTLPPQDQALILRGGIREGMTRDAVYIAWGDPDVVREFVVGGKHSETWVYYGTDMYPAASYGYFPYRGARCRYYEPVYGPVYATYRYYLKSASFVKDRAVAWDAPVR